MNILVLGSNSFLANEFIKYYSKKNYNVYAISRSKNKYINNQNFISYNDLENKIYKIKNIYFDLVLNFISQNIIKKKYLNNNISVLFKIIHQLKKIKIKKIIYFSSVSVYENLNNTKINKINYVEPKSIYAKNKIYEENLIMNLPNNMVCNIVRIPMVIGKNMKSKIFLYLNLYIKYKLYLIIYNPDCIINYISINKLIFYINNDLEKVNKNKIVNLSDNVTFKDIYEIKKIHVKKNFLSILFKYLLKTFMFIKFFNESYKFLYNNKKIYTCNTTLNNEDNNDFLSFLR